MVFSTIYWDVLQSVIIICPVEPFMEIMKLLRHGHGLLALGCGERLWDGTIINRYHVLTAATCCEWASHNNNLTVIVAGHDIRSKYRLVRVVNRTINPNYINWPKFNFTQDFCILRTEDMGLDGKTTDAIHLPDAYLDQG